MPSPTDRCPESNQRSWSSKGFWLSIARIALLEVALLIALAGAAVVYLHWSSEAALSEFRAASKIPAAPNSPLNAIGGQRPCDRGV
jgi:hypothetical protein